MYLKEDKVLIIWKTNLISEHPLKLIMISRMEHVMNNNI